MLECTLCSGTELRPGHRRLTPRIRPLNTQTTMDLLERYAHLENLGNADQYLDEIMKIVDRLPLFIDFQPEEVRELCNLLRCFGAPRNTVLLQEGEPGDFLIMVLTGAISIVKFDSSGKKQIVAVGPGALLGEMSMFGGQPRFATCITEQPTDFAVLSRHMLNQLMVESPALCNKLLLVLLRMCADRLRESTTRLLPYLSGVAL